MPLDSTPVKGSLFRPGHNCSAVARAGRLALLVDGDAYFKAFAAAAARAERSILIVGWDFDSRTPLAHGPDGKPTLLLGEFLNDLCRRNRRLRVRILDWDYPMLFAGDREFPPIYGLNWNPHRHIDFRFDDTHPVAGSHHQKIVVIDDRLAFSGGLDLTNRRWDTREHAAGDPRRVFDDAPYPPFHDVMMAVDGEAAGALAAIARKRWLGATGEYLEPARTRSDPWPAGMDVAIEDAKVAIACTAPACEGSGGVNHVERLYLDMIARARRYIYVENQYFTSDTIADALGRRLAVPDGPEIVLVTRLLSHGWLEENTMTTLRNKLVRQLRAADPHGHLRVLYPHRAGLADGTCVDLHSKVMIVDDEWLRVGSSNLSKRSMGMDTECDLTVEAGGDARIARAIRRFRDDLLAEHSGVPLEAMAREVESAGALWPAIRKAGGEERALRELEAPEVPEPVLSMAAIGDLERPIAIDTFVRSFAPDTRAAGGSPAKGLKVVGLLVAIFVALALMWEYTPLAEYVTRENALKVSEAMADHWWAPVAIVLSYTVASFTMFPRWLITLAAVFAYGAWYGFVFAQTGVLIAASAGYFVGRLVHRDTVRRLAGARLNRLSGVLQKRGILAMTVVRLVPIAPFTVVNMVVGAMRIRLWHFLAGTVLGMMPGMLATTVLSDQFAAAVGFSGHVNYWVIGGALALLGVVGWAGHRWLGRQSLAH